MVEIIIFGPLFICWWLLTKRVRLRFGGALIFITHARYEKRTPNRIKYPVISKILMGIGTWTHYIPLGLGY